MSHDLILDLIPGYALGSLDADDLQLVTRHLQDCPVCRQDVQAYQETVASLAMAAPQYAPSPALKSRLMQKIDQQGAPTNPQQDGWVGLFKALSAWFSSPVGVVAGALAVLMVIALGVNNLVLWSQVRELQSLAAQQELRLVQLSGTTHAPNASGYIVFNPNQSSGKLIVENTPGLSQTQQYQLWLIKDGKRTSGGVFSVNESGSTTHIIRAEKPLDSFQAFGITVEPRGGSPAPTGIKVMGGDL